jgi:peptidoglycan hydrolase FlgJ
MDPVGKVSPSGPAAPAPSPEALKAAKAFETVFLAGMVDGMMKTAPVTGFGGGHAEEMWRSLMAEAYAAQMVAQGGLGIAESLAGAMDAYAAAKAR